MPVLLLLLAVGVLGYLYWRRRTTTLTRNCRWRQQRGAGEWQCAFCGARAKNERAPRSCLRE